MAAIGNSCFWLADFFQIFSEQSLERTFYRSFLPSFTSFGGVSEEKIKMWKVNGRQTTDDGRQVMAKAHIAFDKVS
jgi:hypothetical protein